MKKVSTITFKDILSGDEAVAIVRCSVDQIALCISLRMDGDMEVVMGNKDAEKLIEALNNALAEASEI